MEATHLVSRWMELTKWRHERGRKEMLQQIPEIGKPRQNRSRFGTPELEEGSKRKKEESEKQD